jgi:hypothetical protein
VSYASGEGKSPGRSSLLREKLWGIRPFKRHGLVLLVGGFSYMLTGITYILAEPTESRKIALQVALNIFPIEFWGSVFICAGLLTVISSRWPPVVESWGYGLLAALSAGWSATYAAGVIFDDSPVTNLTGTLNWGLLAFLWWALPGFVNPDKTVVVVIKDDVERSDC